MGGMNIFVNIMCSVQLLFIGFSLFTCGSIFLFNFLLEQQKENEIKALINSLAVCLSAVASEIN